MNRSAIVRALASKESDKNFYDGFVAVVGYEQRARFIATKLHDRAAQHFACAFADRKVLSFEENLEWFTEVGFQVDQRTDNEFRDWCRSVISKITDNERNSVRIAVDISSMSRLRIASLVASLCEISGEKDIQVDFFYAPARYSRGSYQEGPIITSEPVINFFAGWSSEPERAAVTIVGLGTEQDKAVGAIEYLEPGEVWVFKPTGEDEKFDEEVVRANKALLKALLARRIIEYRVDQPYQCFISLESLTYGTLELSRPILVPFGPKIFTLCCLLVAVMHYPKVTVWRVSSGQFGSAVDRIPNGKIVGLTVDFVNSNTDLAKYPL
jgi:hypothetical protein